MKVTIDEGELYPYMYVEKYEGKGRCYEISDELWKRCQKVRKEWWKINEIFEKIVEDEEKKYEKKI